ncbi:MAG TPA: ABC transporter substrate-binding protein [Syntrophomonadaceae bacterium]|nr:ABC transporter substrate-binding protein [Syntrophomonadaceae bacterium]
MRKGKILISFVVVLALLTTAAGCGGNAGTSATSAKDTLVFAQGADPRGLDPALVDDGESAKVIANVFETLVKYKEDSTEIEPCLATSWEKSADGKEWTFKLRRGVKFHDGTDFDAYAVKFTVDRQLPPQVTADMPYASFTFGPVKEVQVVDKYTVKFILKEPYAPFLANLAMSLAAPIVSPAAVKKYGDDFTNNPVGTGPYKFVKWDKGQQVVLEANPNYWGPQPKMKKVVFKIVKENSVRASDLITGAVDIIDGVDPNDVAKLEKSKMLVAKDAGMNINYMGFICDRPPFNNVKLRQAVSYAINKEELVKYLYKDLAQVAPSMLPDFIPGYDPSLKGIPYDPEKAKQLLKEAGYPNGLKVKMITYSNPRPYNPVGGEKLAAAVQAQLAKVGIQAEIQSYPWKEYKDALFKVADGAQIFFYGWTGDNGDPDNFLSLLETKEIESSLNSAKYSNPQVDKLLVEGRTTLDMNRRIEIYKELQKIVENEAPWVFISHGKTLAAYRPGVKNFKYHPTGVVHLWNVEK